MGSQADEMKFLTRLRKYIAKEKILEAIEYYDSCSKGLNLEFAVFR